MLKVIFVSGFGSDGVSKTEHMKEICDKHGWVLEVLTFNYEKANNLDVMIALYNATKGVDECILVGHSLGGFWADIYSRYEKIPAVLINPSMQPWKTLGDKLPIDYKWAFEKTRHSNSSGIVALLEEGDEVLNWKEMIDAGVFDDCKYVMIPGGSHKFEHWEILEQEIINLEGQYFESDPNI